MARDEMMHLVLRLVLDSTPLAMHLLLTVRSIHKRNQLTIGYPAMHRASIINDHMVVQVLHKETIKAQIASLTMLVEWDPTAI